MMINFRLISLSLLVFVSKMHSNIWNLCSSKERLGIIEKTHAHKRHLINIITVKSKLDTHKQEPIHHRSFSPLTPIQKKSLQQNNLKLARKLMSISRTQNVSKQQISVGRNLMTYSSLKRIIRHKEIEEENNKIFSRLIATPSTLKRSNWAKSSRQTEKYKENFNRSHYPQPDYSFQASKIIKSTQKFKCLFSTCSGRNSCNKIVRKQRFL